MTHGALTYRLTEPARTDSRQEGKGREGKGIADVSLHASLRTPRPSRAPIDAMTPARSSSMHAPLTREVYP